MAVVHCKRCDKFEDLDHHVNGFFDHEHNYHCESCSEDMNECVECGAKTDNELCEMSSEATCDECETKLIRHMKREYEKEKNFEELRLNKQEMDLIEYLEAQLKTKEWRELKDG